MNDEMIDAACERTVSLRCGELARLNGAARLRVTGGTLWLTLDGELEDHFLHPGDRFTLDRSAKALLQAIDAPAGIAIADAAPSWPRLAARVLEALQPTRPRNAASTHG